MACELGYVELKRSTIKPVTRLCEACKGEGKHGGLCWVCLGTGYEIPWRKQKKFRNMPWQG